MADGRTILVAETDKVSTQLLTFILRRAGFAVIAATGAADALRRARRERVDLVLSEMLLPEGNGLSLCRELRADWNVRFLPFVFLTSLAAPEQRIQGLLAGADEYLAKPFDVTELLVRLNRLIDHAAVCFHGNPVTRLPSADLAGDYLTSVLWKREADGWTFLTCDLHHFRAYNQLYGYAEGDRVLRLVADLLRELISGAYGANAFVGHAGGDDFIALVPGTDVAALCNALLARFDAAIVNFYPADARESQYHVLIDRRGEAYQVGRLALLIGVMTSDLLGMLPYLELRDMGRELLNRAKMEERSSVFTNRRRAFRAGSGGTW